MEDKTLTFKEIQEILPQRYPFLLIDKVVDYKENESLVAVKNITGNEWAVNENDSGSAAFPETLVIEAAAQATLLLTSQLEKGPSKNLYLIGKVEAEFISAVRIGDQLTLKVLPGKMLKTGGYADISVHASEDSVAKIKIFYSIKQK
ncbi:MAG: 3-hydroxyacyl-ACP dehydratase FabZ family protein [Candidatus Aceula meridiana]|nr:3-hydroxyacyl-ACP dehydratase FabZ family protein [Candidatus Aceula meridiana]